MNKRFAAALAGGACLLSANPAFAGTSTTTIDVTANIQASCRVMGEDTLAFGALSADRTNYTSSYLMVECNTGGSASVTLTSFNGRNEFQMLGQNGNPLPYTVRVNNTDRQTGESFPIPAIAMLSIEAAVSGYAARNSVAGSYTDRIYVNVDY